MINFFVGFDILTKDMMCWSEILLGTEVRFIVVQGYMYGMKNRDDTVPVRMLNSTSTTVRKGSVNLC